MTAAARLSKRESRHHHAQPAPKPAQPAAGEAVWTCPMHPQIVRKEPGSCPICGMALEPMTPAAGEPVNPELRDMTRRFWVGVALSLPLIALAMAEDFVKPALIGSRAAVWLQLLLATCCGAAGPSFSAAGRRSSTGGSTCSL